MATGVLLLEFTMIVGCVLIAALAAFNAMAVGEDGSGFHEAPKTSAVNKSRERNARA